MLIKVEAVIELLKSIYSLQFLNIIGIEANDIQILLIALHNNMKNLKEIKFSHPNKATINSVIE